MNQTMGSTTKKTNTKGATTTDEGTPSGGNAPYEPKINVKSFYNSNTISQNFNQGILLVEGSFATIIANKIDKNIKANIALGGKDCGQT